MNFSGLGGRVDLYSRHWLQIRERGLDGPVKEGGYGLIRADQPGRVMVVPGLQTLCDGPPGQSLFFSPMLLTATHCY